MQVIGWTVIALGAFLWSGNVFHFFHTFPLAGYGTMVLGRLIMKFGPRYR